MRYVSLAVTLLGGGFVGHLISGKKNANDDKQNIIDQLQEEVKRLSDGRKEQDTKIDNLYAIVRELEQKYGEVVQEKRELEWKLKRTVAEKEILEEEKEKLLGTVTRLENHVEKLEKELVFTKGG